MADSSSTPLDTLWQHTLDHWDEGAAHEAFVQQAHQSEELAVAATRYREMVDDPAKADTAQRQLEAITMLAFASIEAAKTNPPNLRRPLALAAILFSLALITAVMLSMR